MKIWLFISVLLTMTACGKRSEAAFPRPTAYPRPNLPDTAMTVAADAPLYFLVNQESVVDAPKPGWLDVAYPMIGATVHVTFTKTSPAEVVQVKENRMERLMLNAGDGELNLSEFSNQGGFDILLASSEGSSTPIQFLATDDEEWVVSGAVYFSSADAATAIDSMRPVVQTIRRDIVKSLNELRLK